MADDTLGVEEEYQLLDAESGDLRPANMAVLESAAPAMGDTVHAELMRSQIEVSTPVCHSLEQVDTELRALRRRLGAVAATHGCRLGAAGSHPTAFWQNQEITPKARYVEMADELQQMARETLIFGCHVHVGIDDPELRIAVLNRIRPWLPVLVALSASSPFWAGRDTGYASYRTVVFRRWPTTGVPHRFAGFHEYQELVDCLVAAGAIEDATHIYWDVRPSARFPTLELRIADVCLTVDEAVTLAGMTAAMVSSARADALGGGEPPDPRPELLEAAVWRAARHGLEERLIDVEAGELRPAIEVVGDVLQTLRPAMEEAGTWDRVDDGVAQVLREGTGAERQRAAYRRRGRLGDVAHLIAEETAGGL